MTTLNHDERNTVVVALRKRMTELCLASQRIELQLAIEREINHAAYMLHMAVLEHLPTLDTEDETLP